MFTIYRCFSGRTSNIVLVFSTNIVSITASEGVYSSYVHYIDVLVDVVQI